MRETLRYVSTHDERGRCNYDALSLAQDGIDSLPGNVRVVAMIGDRAEVLVVTETVGRIHRHIHFKRFGLLLSVSAAVCLSGCLTPAKLAEMAQRADTLSRGAKTDECADAAANAASAVVVALEDMTRATRLSDPMQSPKSALRLAEVACLECVKDTDCAADQECVGGHCQKRRK
jgi:outer membrane murein-binding lipoprotein Lpp